MGACAHGMARDAPDRITAGGGRPHRTEGTPTGGSTRGACAKTPRVATARREGGAAATRPAGASDDRTPEACRAQIMKTGSAGTAQGGEKNKQLNAGGARPHHATGPHAAGTAGWGVGGGCARLGAVQCCCGHGFAAGAAANGRAGALCAPVVSSTYLLGETTVDGRAQARPEAVILVGSFVNPSEFF